MQKTHLLIIASAVVIVLAGGALGYTLGTKVDNNQKNGANNATTNVAINNSASLNGNSNVNGSINDNENTNTQTNSNANTNQAPAEETLNVNWITPQTITSLALFTSQNDYSREDSAEYYKVGTVSGGALDGGEVILVAAYPEGPAFAKDVYRFIKKDNALTLIQGSSDELYEGDYLDRAKFSTNTTDTFQGFSFPEQITGLEPRQTLVLDPWPFALFDSSQLTKAFTHPQYGDVYMTKGYPEPSSGNIFSRHGFFIKNPDGTTRVYKLKIDFVSDAGVPDVAWNKGAVNEKTYDYAVRTGCGSSNYVKVMDPSVVSVNADLQKTGINSFGDPIYEFKDSNSQILKDLYDDEYYVPEGTSKLSYSDFVLRHPVFYWVDPYDRLIEFRSGEFMPQAECGKPVIYLYPEQEQDISVKVNPVGGMTYADPAYGNGWKVRATPDGNLTELATGMRYPYLFWEGKGGIYAQPKEGFVVAQRDVHAFLVSTLARLGLNQKETGDFIEFWESRMQSAPYYFITFLRNKEMDQLAPLAVTPAPDTVIRILMDFSPLQTPIQAKGFPIATPERKGFTVVEWGGVIRP